MLLTQGNSHWLSVCVCVGMGQQDVIVVACDSVVTFEVHIVLLSYFNTSALAVNCPSIGSRGTEL